MYYVTKNFTVSTSRLIEILETNSFKITSDESGVFIYDSIYTENTYCPYSLIKQLLVKAKNPIYLYYLDIMMKNQEDSFDSKFASKALDTKITSAKELIDRLLYYKSIVHCCTKLSRVKRTIKSFTPIEY